MPFDDIIAMNEENYLWKTQVLVKMLNYLIRPLMNEVSLPKLATATVVHTNLVGFSNGLSRRESCSSQFNGSLVRIC